MRRAAALVLTLLVACSTAHAQRSPLGRWNLTSTGEGSVDAGGGACSDPYALYDTLCLEEIPWHGGAGGWGAQVTLDAPTLPTITSSANASTAAEFNAAAGTAGVRITVTGSWSGDVQIHADDVEVIVSATRSIAAIEVGVFPHATTYHRIRIAGSVDGLTHGGVTGQIRTDPMTDLVIDGLDNNGSSAFGGGETNQAFRVNATRVAVLNTRAISAGYCWEGTNSHVVLANSNFYCGAQTRATTGYDEGWAFRNIGGPITVWASHIETTRYATMRPQSVDGAGELFYVGGGSIIVERAEQRLFWFWDGVGNDPGAVGDGAIVENSYLYGYGATGCGGAPISCEHTANVSTVAYARVSGNAFYSAGAVTWSQGTLDTADTACSTTATIDFSSGQANTFATWTADPVWGGPGDPREIDLIGFGDPTNGEGSCLGFTP